MMLFSLLTTLSAPLALGQSEPAALDGFVRYVSIAAPDDVDMDATRDQLEIELRAFGMTISQCDELRERDAVLDETIAERYPTWRHDPDLLAEKQVLTAQCTPSDPRTTFYAAKVSLAVDPDLGNQRRANVQLIPLGEGADQQTVYVGGFAHRPFRETLSWSDVLSRAIDRAASGQDEAPAVELRGPRRVQLEGRVRLDARRSWDPDGDPFILRWTATVPGCETTTRDGRSIVLPMLERCPSGTTAVEAYEVPLNAGETSRDRVLEPPTVGRYTVEATPRSKGRETEADAHLVIVEPAHPTFVGVHAGLVQLPADLFVFGDERSLSPEIGLHWLERVASGVSGRFVHDLLLGLSSTLHLRQGDVLLQGAPLFSIGADLAGRLYGPRGAWGLEYGARVGLGSAGVAVDFGFVTGRSAWLPMHARVGLFRQDRKVTWRDDRPCRGLGCTTIGASFVGNVVLVTQSGNLGISLGPQLTVQMNP